jgi:hypothetical protein
VDFAETTEHRDLRAAVAAIASGFGPKYYLDHAAAGTPCDELWSQLGEAGFIGVTSRPSTAAVAAGSLSYYLY